MNILRYEAVVKCKKLKNRARCCHTQKSELAYFEKMLASTAVAFCWLKRGMLKIFFAQIKCVLLHERLLLERQITPLHIILNSRYPSIHQHKHITPYYDLYSKKISSILDLINDDVCYTKM